MKRGLQKEGLPSRAEVTDAAMANRAECGRLNKGPCRGRLRRAWERMVPQAIAADERGEPAASLVP
jgi:hypothetical protein